MDLNNVALRPRYLWFGGFVFLPLSAGVEVLFPLLAGRRGAVGVVVVKTVPEAFAVSKFTPGIVARSRRLHGQTRSERYVWTL